ncbi:transcriptional activator ChrR, partial [Pseudomonas savastanoi pv. glycinea str. race 4]
MSPRHHPGDATLVSYAAGALSQVLAVVTAAHLERCAECRARLRQAEEIGG